MIKEIKPEIKFVTQDTPVKFVTRDTQGRTTSISEWEDGKCISFETPHLKL